MKKTVILVTLAFTAALGAIGCATMAGAAIGGGIAELSGGDARTGALIGGSVGAVVDIVD
jgi:hypothetical protein